MHRNKKGFTLLEIILALAILVIGVVGVLVIFPVGLRASKRGGDFTMATILAQRQMETIRRVGHAIYGTAHHPERTFPAPDDKFSFSVVGTATAIANLSRVTVEIYWIDRGAVRSERFITYLARRD
jgi:prepilin-type N-terminal cleavage/methylation domain-containing protein